jgi:uncharacterized repeat protein (TIGR01451 family)
LNPPFGSNLGKATAIAPIVTSPTDFIISATGTTPTSEADLANNTGSATITVNPPPLPSDLTVIKTHSGSFALGQTGGTYTITVSNVGGGPTFGTVSVADALPTGLTATDISGPGWTCVLGTLTCTRTDVLAASASYPPITLTVSNAALPGGIFGSAFPGDTSDPATLYSISPTNGSAVSVGSIGFQQVSALDFGPAGVLYGVGKRISDSTEVLLTVNTLTGAGTEVGPLGVFGNWPDMAFRPSDGTLFAMQGGNLYTINTTTGAATLVGSTGVGGGGNGLAFSPAVVLYLASGTNLYTLDTSNGASTLVIPLNFSAFPICDCGYRVNGMKFDALTGTLWASVYDGNSIHYLGTINTTTGVVANVGVTANDLDALAVHLGVTNTATVSGGGEVNTANGTASDVTILTPSDLAVAKTHAGNFTQGQTGASYSITVTNTGANPTSGTVTVTDALPAGLTPTALSGTGWSCVLGTLTCTRSDALAPGAAYPVINLTVNVGASAASNPLVLGSASSGPAAPATLYSLSPATGAATTIGPIGFNQVGALALSPAGILYGEGLLSGARQLLTINPTTGAGAAIGPTGLGGSFQDLAFRPSDGALFGFSGGDIYTLNTATGTATLVGSTGFLTSGHGLAFSPTNVLYNIAADVLYSINQSTGAAAIVSTLNFSAFPVGSNRVNGMQFDPLTGTLWASVTQGSGINFLGTIDINTGVVTPVGPSVAGLDAIAVLRGVNNTVTASGGSEVNASNSTAANPTVINAPDLIVSKSHAGSFTQGQTGATYTITVTNIGTAATSGTVTVADTLPAGLTATDISGTGWSCVLATLTCTRSNALGPAASYPPITLTVNVASNAPPGGIFGAAYPNPSSPATLYSISPANGAATAIGNIGFTRVSGLAFSPTGVLFGGGQAGSQQLITVDPSTGVGTAVGPTGLGDPLHDLTFRPSDGALFGLSGCGDCGDADLYRINPATGAVTQIGVTFTTNGGNGLAFSPSNVLYSVQGGNLNTLNQTTGVPTLVKVLDFTAFPAGPIYKVNGMKFDPLTGTLWAAVNGSGTNYLGTINIATGVVTNIGTSVTRLDALAIQSPITNTVSVSGGGDVNPSNNLSNDPTPLDPFPADLLVFISEDTDPLVGGDPLNYVIGVFNLGLSSAAAVTVTDTIPAGLTISSCLFSLNGSLPTACPPPIGQTQSVSFGTLGAGEFGTVSIDVTTPVVVSQTFIVNTATATTGSTEISTANNSATATTTANPVAGAPQEGGGPPGGNVSALTQSPFSPDIIFAATRKAGVFKSTNSGSDWTPVNSGLTTLDVRSITAAPDSGTVYAGTELGGIFRSTNGGATWTNINGTGLPVSPRITSIVLDPDDSKIVFVGDLGDGVFKTLDATVSSPV